VIQGFAQVKNINELQVVFRWAMRVESFIRSKQRKQRQGVRFYFIVREVGIRVPGTLMIASRVACKNKLVFRTNRKHPGMSAHEMLRRFETTEMCSQNNQSIKQHLPHRNTSCKASPARTTSSSHKSTFPI
jgi:hypothetical protein